MLQEMQTNISTCLEWADHLKVSERFHLGIRKTSHARDDGVSASNPAHTREIPELVLLLKLEIHLPTWTYISARFCYLRCSATNRRCCQDPMCHLYNMLSRCSSSARVEWRHCLLLRFHVPLLSI